MPTADDDSVPVSQAEFKLPRALLNWEPMSRRGVVERELDTQPTPVSRRAPFAGSRASRDAFDEDPTTAMPVVSYSLDRPDAPQEVLAHETEPLDAGLTRTVQLWHDRRLRTAVIVAGVALLAYLAVDRVRHRSEKSSQTILSPAAAVRTVGPIIVEQLSEAPHGTAAAPERGKRTDAPGRRSAGRRARDTPFATASTNRGDHPIAPAHSKSGSAPRSSSPVVSDSAALPAWGEATMRDFSGTKSGKAASATAESPALTAKPAASSAGTPPPVAAAPPAVQEQPKPSVAAKVAEPPEPVAPPRPSKPLTMEQMMNQVEEAAQAQRKKAGLKAPKSSERDAELEALISGAMKK